jgi:hypothetical protein
MIHTKFTLPLSLCHRGPKIEAASGAVVVPELEAWRAHRHRATATFTSARPVGIVPAQGEEENRPIPNWSMVLVVDGTHVKIMLKLSLLSLDAGDEEGEPVEIPDSVLTFELEGTVSDEDDLEQLGKLLVAAHGPGDRIDELGRTIVDALGHLTSAVEGR